MWPAKAQSSFPRQVVIVDGGTTTSELIAYLPADLRITVVTHSPSIALGLVEHPSIEVILIGGRLYKHSIVTVGAAAIEGIDNIHADLFFMGVTGIHPEAGLLPAISKRRASNVHFPAGPPRQWSRHRQKN